jgi:hypothetical protein
LKSLGLLPRSLAVQDGTPASALGPSHEAFDVPRAGAKKIEEIDIFKSTRLAEAKQDQKIAETLLRGRPFNHAPKRSESLWREHRIVA